MMHSMIVAAHLVLPGVTVTRFPQKKAAIIKLQRQPNQALTSQEPCRTSVCVCVGGGSFLDEARMPLTGLQACLSLTHAPPKTITPTSIPSKARVPGKENMR